MAADVTELYTLSKDLVAVSSDVERRSSQAVRRAAIDLQGHAKQLAPVDTGNLRSLIKFKNRDQLTVDIVSGANYAVFQEYGTRFQPGRPHMRPALERVTPGFEQALAQIAGEI